VVAGGREERLAALLGPQRFQVVMERGQGIAALPGQLTQPDRRARMRRIAPLHLLVRVDRLVASTGELSFDTALVDLGDRLRPTSPSVSMIVAIGATQVPEGPHDETERRPAQ